MDTFVRHARTHTHTVYQTSRESRYQKGKTKLDFTEARDKKGDLKQCANYRTIALVSHASKILLRIILERIRVKTETEIADEQAGF